MRRLTTILVLVPVVLVLLAPPASLASAKAELESGMAGPGCPHQQESRRPSKPSRSEHDCHHCCISLVAGTVAPAMGAAGSLPLQERLRIGVPPMAPAEPDTRPLSERGPPPPSSC